MSNFYSIDSHNPCHIAIRQRCHINYLIYRMLLKELLPGSMNYVEFIVLVQIYKRLR